MCENGYWSPAAYYRSPTPSYTTKAADEIDPMQMQEGENTWAWLMRVFFPWEDGSIRKTVSDVYNTAGNVYNAAATTANQVAAQIDTYNRNWYSEKRRSYYSSSSTKSTVPSISGGTQATASSNPVSFLQSIGNGVVNTAVSNFRTNYSIITGVLGATGKAAADVKEQAAAAVSPGVSALQGAISQVDTAEERRNLVSGSIHATVESGNSALQGTVSSISAVEEKRRQIADDIGKSVLEYGDWWESTVAKPAEKIYKQNADAIPGLGTIYAAELTGLTNVPGVAMSTGGAVIIGSGILYDKMAADPVAAPSVFVEYATQGLQMQYDQTVENLQTRPIEFLTENAGMYLLTHGVTKGAGKISPIKIRTAEVPTGGFVKNKFYFESIPEIIYKLAGAEKTPTKAVVNKYTVVTVENPLSRSPTSGRIIAGVARTVKGTGESVWETKIRIAGQKEPVWVAASETARKTEFFKGSPAEIVGKTDINIKAPLDKTNTQPWSKGLTLIMKEHLKRSATPEAGDLIMGGLEIQDAVRSRGVRTAVDQQVQPFDLTLETFGGKGGAGNRAIIEVLSSDKYKGRVTTGGSISQRAYMPKNAFRDVSFSDIDIWVKDAATAVELYGDLTKALEKTGHINYEVIGYTKSGKPIQTHLAKSGSFEIFGTGVGRGIGAHTWDQFPEIKGLARPVKTVLGGEIDLVNPIYNLESKLSGAFENGGIRYKAGTGKTELLTPKRAKDIPDIYAYSRQAAAHVYDTRLSIDVIGRRAARRERIANSYERVSAAARKFGIDLEKTKQGRKREISKNLKPSEIGSGITIGQKVKQTLTKEITVDVLKGNRREVRSTLDIFGTRGEVAPGPLGEDAALLIGKAARETGKAPRDIYPMGKTRPRSIFIEKYRGLLPVARPRQSATTTYPTRYPKKGTDDGYTKGSPTTRYPRQPGTGGYKGKNPPQDYPRKTPPENYPGKTPPTNYPRKIPPSRPPGYPPATPPTQYPTIYPNGPTPPEAPPTERLFLTTGGTTPIPKKKRRDTDIDLFKSRKYPRYFSFEERAPVASHLELLKGITNARRRRKKGSDSFLD